MEMNYWIALLNEIDKAIRTRGQQIAPLRWSILNATDDTPAQVLMETEDGRTLGIWQVDDFMPKGYNDATGIDAACDLAMDALLGGG